MARDFLLAAQIELELERRRKLAALREADAERRPDFLADLFESQRQAVTNAAFVSAWLAGRRYGKSTGASRWLLDGCWEMPGTAQLYTSKTRLHAKEVLWEELQRTLASHGFQRVMGEPKRPREYSRNDTELHIRVYNGSSVRLGGLKDKGEADKIRGPQKLHRKFIDECGAVPPTVLEYAAEQVIEPASVDVEGPTIYAGTPGMVWHGYWYEMTGAQSMGVPVHTGTMFDNPHLPHAARLAAEIKAKHKWPDDHPTWVREWLGRWSRDLESMVFPWDRSDSVAELPKYRSPWSYVLAIDVGQTHASGYVLWAWHINDPFDYVLKSWKREHQLIDSMADDIRMTWSEVGQCPVVVDTGGMGKQHAAELTARKGIGVIPADKREKASALRVIGDRIKGHMVKVVDGPQNDAIRDDWALCKWNDERDDIAEDSKDPTSHRDVAHASLYGHRNMRNYLYSEVKPEPTEAEMVRQRVIQRKLRRNTGLPTWDR